jgi:hypothetical protein
MNTSQYFFNNVLNNNANTFAVVNNIIGDYDKNSGLAASFYELATNILGNTVTDNNDLSQIFGNNQNQFESDNSDILNQSLRNSTIGIAYSNFYSYPIDICTHISTNLFTYSASISSTFLSAQIYSFSTTGVSTNSKIILPISSINFSGNLNKSWLIDVPMDFAVYGINNFTSNFTGSTIIKFDYGWSFCNNQTKLIVNLGYTTANTSNFYFITYWGNSSSSFINTSNTIVNNIVYTGTNSFINNISLSTQNLVVPTNFQSFTTRKNFWSSSYPYSINFVNNSFIDTTTYLHTPDRLNFNLVDGISQTYQSSNVFLVNGSYVFSGLSTNYCVLYFDSATSGGVSANFQLDASYSSGFKQRTNENDLKNTNIKNVPLAYVELEFNSKKSGSNISPFSLSYTNQLVPSAYTKNISDNALWGSFSKPLIAGKNSFNNYLHLTNNFLSTFDNFFASYLFDYQFADVSNFFSGNSLRTSQYTLKLFTQPYSFYRTPPLNFNQNQENALYAATTIVSSKEFLTFSEGKLEINSNFNLPTDYSFEIFKPISLVCNGIDPYKQGQGLALDYTLNLQFEYKNQNILQKTLYLMASKYLLTENEYNNQVNSNKSTVGFYWYVDPVNTQAITANYSVSSIKEFYLYGYSGLIPDLKDGITRPILTRQFSPEDGSKYTYDQFIALLKTQNPNITEDQINDAVQNYLDSGGQFYTINTSSFSNNFNNLTDISLCATNYINAYEQNKYWNDSFVDFSKTTQAQPSDDGHTFGFTQLTAQIISGSLLGTSITQISAVSVGYNCVVDSVSVISIGSSQVPGNYQEYVLPNVLSSGIFNTEQPAVISYTVTSAGSISPTSLKLINPGSNFYYDFSYTIKCGINTGGTRAILSVKMDNTFNFSAALISGPNSTLSSMKQISTPAYGYNFGFYLNPNTFNSLGYNPSNINVQIMISNNPTVDSFLISKKGLSAGVLENFSNFDYATNDFSSINLTTGADMFYLYDNEIINAIVVPPSLQGKSISYVGLECKLINLIGYVPSGYFQVVFYKPDSNNQPDLNNIAAVSDKIDVSSISNNTFNQINVPVSFTFYNTLNGDYVNRYSSNKNGLIYISIKQQINSGILAFRGQFNGISTSGFSISSSQIQNSNTDLIIYGNRGVSTGNDLDLVYPIRFDILQGTSTTSINSSSVYLRKNTSVTNSSNLLSLIIYTPTQNYISNVVNFSSLTDSFSVVSFNYNTNISTSQILYAGISFSSKIQQNQIYISRDLTKYNYALGLGTTSIINNNGSLVNFDFIFNKLFVSVNPEILGAFNFTDASQFGLAKPNRNREIPPVNIIDGYWAFKGKQINSPVSIYPRAFLSYSSVIGTATPSYSYLGYTHDICVAVGYNYLGVTSIETHTLSARPAWKTTWMTRDNTNYKNFNISNVFIQSYFDSINYQAGTASTLIGAYNVPKNAVFEGVFNPGTSNNPLPISVQIGTSAGVQIYLNNSSQPVIDTFAVLSTTNTTINYSISTAVRQSSINFKVLYFTLGTAVISLGWNTTYNGVSTLISSGSSKAISNSPVDLNGGLPIDNLVFLNVSKTDTNSQINFGYPTGDSFVIRSS